MTGVEVIAALLVMTITLVALGHRWRLPYPIVLVLGGLAVGFVGNVPRFHVAPEVMLALFLPPLLYWEAVSAPTHAMRRNASWLASLAVGLVFVTAWAVAAAMHAILPTMSWAVALTLGAIVAPTDSVAPAAILERLGISPNIVAIVTGESLLNDAAALALFGVALGSVSSGTLAPGAPMLHFLVGAAGALAVGLAAGWLAVAAWRAIRDSQLQGLISIALPFVAFLPAQRLGLSGVLAVVSAGLYVNRWIPVVMLPGARLMSYGYWETLVFVTNALIFVLVGIELRDALPALGRYPLPTIVAAVVLANAAVIVTRFAFVLLARSRIGRKQRIVVAWSGLRGGVSLAIALSIPQTLPNGTPFPYRALIVSITFSVILVTLVGGGLTLPLAIRRLGIERDDEESRDERRALLATTRAALRRLEQLERNGTVDADLARTLRARYLERERRTQQPDDCAGDVEQRLAAEHELFEAERRVLVELRRDGEIDNVTLRRLQLSVDLSEAGDSIARRPIAEPPPGRER
jgi:Na+/H+ antiporter